MKISVIIPTYNRAEILKLCLESLVLQDFDKYDFEVIVSDDGSTDNTEQVFYSLDLPDNFKYLKQKNKGPAGARNLAIRNSTGELLLIINDDTILEKSALTKHWNFYTNSDKKTILLGKFEFSKELQINPFLYCLEKFELLFPYSNAKTNELNGFNFFWTCNISFPRNALDKAGLFDEDYSLTSYEDIECGYRLEQAGYLVKYDPSIYAEHYHDWTIENFCNYQKTCSTDLIKLLMHHPEITKRGIIGFNRLSSKDIEQTKKFISENALFVEEGVKAIEEIGKMNFKDIFLMNTEVKNIFLESVLLAFSKLIVPINNYNYKLGFLKGLINVVDEIIELFYKKEFSKAIELNNKIKDLGLDNPLKETSKNLKEVIQYFFEQTETNEYIEFKNDVFEYYQECLNNSKGNEIIRTYLNYYFEKNNFEKCINLAMLLIKNQSAKKDDYIIISKALEIKGDLETSKQFYKKALEVDE